MFTIPTATAALAVAVTIGAGAAEIASAAPNTGGSAGTDSAYCTGLRDRAQRFNDIAHDARQPKGVREFYKNRALVVLDAARRAGCAWATVQAAQASPSPDAAERGEARPAGPAARTARTTATRRSFTTIEKRRKARRPIARGDVKVKGGAPAGALRISATTTGNPRTDSYCKAAAELITDAELQGDTAAGNDQSDSAQEWWDLAEDMIDVASRNGCRFQA